MTQVERINAINADMEYPEKWPWNLHNKESVIKITTDICYAINRDFGTIDRNFVPGLRMALRVIENTYPFEVD